MSKKHCHHYKIKKTYCLSCRKHTDNIALKRVIKTNKVVRQSSKYANSVAEKSRSF